jgi:hypothetical protein
LIGQIVKGWIKADYLTKCERYTGLRGFGGDRVREEPSPDYEPVPQMQAPNRM